MHEERVSRRFQLVEQVAAAGGQSRGADADAREPLHPLVAGERPEAAAGRRDDRERPLVVGLAQLGVRVEAARRSGREDRQVDSLRVHPREPQGRVVRREVGLVVGLDRQLEPRAAQSRALAAPLERPDQRLGPEVLVHVDRRHGRATSVSLAVSSASARPPNRSTRWRLMSMPAATPAAVITSPSSTKRTSRSTCTAG